MTRHIDHAGSSAVHPQEQQGTLTRIVQLYEVGFSFSDALRIALATCP